VGCENIREVSGMKLSSTALALAVALVVTVALVMLLTPLGVESRPATELKTVGYVAIGTIFAGLVLDVVAFALLFTRPRWASTLAIIGSVLFVFPIVGDQAGAFFSLPIPPAVNTLEYALAVALLVTLFLAWQVHRESSPSPG
jgi:hypothetical protein